MLYLDLIFELYRTRAKNQVKAKQHPEAELLRFEDYSLFSSTLSSKNNWSYF